MNVPQRRPPEETPPPSRWGRVLDSPWTLLVAVLTVGPFAIPLVWRSARYSRRTKIFLSVAIVLLTVALSVFLGVMTSYFLKSMEAMMDA